MKKKTIYRKLNYQPTQLQQHQLEDPFILMDYFFRDYPIHQIRSTIWELYKGWAYHSSQYADQQIIKDMLCFYTQISEVMDACYLYTKSKTNQP